MTKELSWVANENRKKIENVKWTENEKKFRVEIKNNQSEFLFSFPLNTF